MTESGDKTQAIIIIGAGQAGGRAAEALRQAGHVGSITLIGEEPHPPYERPPLSKEILIDGSDRHIAWVRPNSWYCESGIDLRKETLAVGIDRAGRQVVLQDGGSPLPYDRLIIATGSRPRSLTAPGADHPRCTALRSIDDSRRIFRALTPDAHIVVIGAGFIGLEVAAAARRRGSKVTVVEQAEFPLARGVPADIGRFYAELHRSQGVQLRTSCHVSHISSAPGVAAVHCADGETYLADLVVVGIGVLPNCELAAAADLDVDNGVVVDEFGRTSDPSIYAAGDVTNHFNPLLGRHIRLESWQNAQNQAIAVARNIMGANQPYAEIPWFWSDQFGHNLQIAGQPTAEDRCVERGALRFYFRGDRLIGAIGIDGGRDMRFARELISLGGKVDPEDLSDPGVKLADLCRSLKTPATPHTTLGAPS